MRSMTGGAGGVGLERGEKAERMRGIEKRVERAWKNKRIELKVFPLSTLVFIMLLAKTNRGRSRAF
jgi:hypothetical protein